MEEYLAMYNRATRALEELQCRQGLSRKARLSMREAHEGNQRVAQMELMSLLTLAGCHAASTVGMFLFPCDDDIVTKPQMQQARQELTRMMLCGTLTLEEGHGR